MPGAATLKTRIRAAFATVRAAGHTNPVTGENAAADELGTAIHDFAGGEVTVAEQVKAGFNVSGGGTITWSSGGKLKWDARFIVISNGRGPHFSTTGHFEIIMPTSGTLIGVGGASNQTWASDGTDIGVWRALYYILPIGSVETSLPANFRLAHFSSDLEVPADWILLAVRNSDGTNTLKVCTGIHLNLGQSRTNKDGAGSGLDADLLDGNDWTAPGPIGETTPGTGRFTTVESTIATGTSPLTVASTTKVVNLNADKLDGNDFPAPGTIGNSTAASAFFTNVTATRTGTNVGFFAHVFQIGFQCRLAKDDNATLTVYMDCRRSNNVVTGRLQTNSSGVFQLVDSSDARSKSNIKPVETDCLSFVCNIPVSEYDRSGKHHVGFVAQEVQSVFPDMVSELQAENEPWPDDTGPSLGISRTAIIPYLTRAIQQLRDQVEKLEAQLK